MEVNKNIRLKSGIVSGIDVKYPVIISEKIRGSIKKQVKEEHAVRYECGYQKRNRLLKKTGDINRDIANAIEYHMLFD